MGCVPGFSGWPRSEVLVRREFPESPIVGVGAVVLDGDRVLLVRRGREPLRGEWSLPGGALELGETLTTGVRREVAEETGLHVKVLGMVEVLDRIVLEETAAGERSGRVRYHYVLVDFLCEVVEGDLRAASDAADARWVSHEELNSHSIYRLAPATAAVIEKAFRMRR
jgi:8-oxo-dGTP diphosphatase